MPKRKNYFRITKKTPIEVIFIIILLTLAQQLGWLARVEQKLVPIEPGFYRVTQFYDGDTVAVDMDGKEEKIRMIGVDTPETKDPRKPVQCFGQAASDFTKQLIGNQNVRLEADPTNSNRDRYNRLLRYVYLPDKRLVNAEIIREGYGFAYTSFPFTKLEEFRAMEAEAKAANRGLWSTCNPEVDSRGFIRSNDQ